MLVRELYRKKKSQPIVSHSSVCLIKKYSKRIICKEFELNDCLFPHKTKLEKTELFKLAVLKQGKQMSELFLYDHNHYSSQEKTNLITEGGKGTVATCSLPRATHTVYRALRIADLVVVKLSLSSLSAIREESFIHTASKNRQRQCSQTDSRILIL